MQELEVTWGRAIKVWWSLAWRWLIFLVVVALVLVVDLMFLPGEEIGLMFPYVAVIPMSIWIVKLVLGTAYSDFPLVLLVREADLPTPT
jgi:hypothetical protein